MSEALTASCPSCGANLTFQVGHSRAAVCSYCHALVARKGQDFEAVGKVADLIATGTPLSLGLTGKVGQHTFVLVGRLQYEWEQGAWDEWYASLDDGRWGWLAEAQGRCYLTFPESTASLPREDTLGPGTTFVDPTYGAFTFTDRKRARIAGVEGELPEAVRVGEVSVTADFEGPNGVFATVDDSPGEPRRLFLGRQVTLAQLGLHPVAKEDKPSKGRAKAGSAVQCPNCHAPFELRVPDQSVRAVCGSCGAVLDTSQGAMRVLEVLQKHNSVPPLPLGTEGVLRGRVVQVVGWMRRSCVVDGITYDWQELLLFEAKEAGFLWLVLTDGHWQLAEPVSAGEVSPRSANVSFRNQLFKRFSAVTGVVDEVLGEFYWTVKVGDRAELVDYIRPPLGLSSETSEDEVNWSRVTHLEAAELAKAFRKPGLTAVRTEGVGAVQPYPYDQAATSVMRWLGFALLGVIALGLVFAARGRTPVYQHRFSQQELFTGAHTPASVPPPPPGVPEAFLPAPAPGGPPGPPASLHHYSFLSERFHLPANRSVEVELATDVDNHWAYAAGALIPAQSGPSPTFGLEASYYHGYSGGESWSEGGQGAVAAVSAPAEGDYVLRSDLEWDPKLPAPPTMELRVFSGGWSGWQLLFALLALGAPALLLIFHRSAFEKQRWENSTEGGE